MAIKQVRPSSMDPVNSVDLFDADRRNEFGERYCIAPAILPEQVDEEWSRYLEELPPSLREPVRRFRPRSEYKRSAY